MKPIVELDMDNPKEAKALKTVLRKINIGSFVACLKQAVKTKEDEYVSNVLQAAVADEGAMALIDGGLLYITLRDLKNHNVKEIQELWKTVLRRGTTQFTKGEANDYYLTIDCIMIDKSAKKMYTLGCYRTPLFCSSDGDADLTLAMPLEDCFISIDNYDAREIEYAAVSATERGETVKPLLKKNLPEDDEIAEEKKKAYGSDILDFAAPISKETDDDDGEDKDDEYYEQ